MREKKTEKIMYLRFKKKREKFFSFRIFLFKLTQFINLNQAFFPEQLIYNYIYKNIIFNSFFVGTAQACYQSINKIRLFKKRRRRKLRRKRNINIQNQLKSINRNIGIKLLHVLITLYYILDSNNTYKKAHTQVEIYKKIINKHPPFWY